MGLLDHVKIENLDEDQRKMVELVGLDGFKKSCPGFWRHYNLYSEGREPGTGGTGSEDPGRI